MDFAMDNDLDMELLSLKRHAEWKGKVGTEVKAPVKSCSDFNMAFVPGCIEPCLEIEYDEKASFAYSGRCNKVAVISDGSAVLNLGNIGPAASLPYIEGKCAVFKAAAGVDAVPLCVTGETTEKLIQSVEAFSKNFGAVSLTGIEKEKSLLLQKELAEKCQIPVWADEIDAFAIAICAGIINTAKFLNKDTSAMLTYVKLSDADYETLSMMAEEMDLGRITRQQEELVNADLFVDLVTDIDGLNIAQKSNVPVVLGLSNQKAAMLAAPGVFKGLLDSKCKTITKDMKEAAARALASVIYDDEICEDDILPGIFEIEVIEAISAAIVDVCGKEGMKGNV